MLGVSKKVSELKYVLGDLGVGPMEPHDLPTGRALRLPLLSVFTVNIFACIFEGGGFVRLI